MTEETEKPYSAGERFNQFAETASRYVVPLFNEAKGFPEAVGTGFLLKVGQQTLLVSAAHVLDEIIEGNPLFFYSDVNRGRRVRGPIRTTPAPNGDRSKDKLDVGIVFLSGRDLPPYEGVDKDAAPLGILGSARIPRNSHINFFAGFPASKSVVKRGKARGVVSNVHTFAIRPADSADYGSIGLREEDHIILPFNPTSMVDTDGKKVQLPKLNGMSGSAVWQLGNGENESPRIVGVVTKLLNQDGISRVIATEIGVVADMVNAPESRVKNMMP